METLNVQSDSLNIGRSSILKIEEMEGNITPDNVFRNKYSIVYKDFDISTREYLGRVLKPRKMLTELKNNGLPTNEWECENLACFDYIVKRRNKNHKLSSNDENIISYDYKHVTQNEYKSPSIGDEIVILHQNVNERDNLTPKEINCRVIDVFPFKIRFDIRSGQFVKIRSSNHGTVVLEILPQNKNLRRSLMVEPVVPKFKRKNLDII